MTAPIRSAFRKSFLPLVALLLSMCACSTGLAQGTVATPIFAPNAADSAVPLSVTITCTTLGATIRYTTTGVAPTTSDAVVASGGAVMVGRNLTLMASAWLNGWTPSAVQSATYRVTGAVSGGGKHALGLKSDGKVWSWGAQADGRLGNYQTASLTISSPIQVQQTGAVAFVNAVDVAGGHSHSMAVDSTGQLWAWGDNSNGQVGANSSSNAITAATQVLKSPVFSDFLTGIVQCDAGSNFSLAVEASGQQRVWSFGSQKHGRLGSGSSSGVLPYAQPVELSTGSTLQSIVQVAAGERFGLARHSNGTLFAWGDNAAGQLGIGSTNQQTRAVQVAGFSPPTAIATEIAAGHDHSVAVRVSYTHTDSVTYAGTVWCWGAQGRGRLGNGTTATANKTSPIGPVLKAAGGYLTGIIQVAGGPQHTLALDSNGKVWAWGDNRDGQLGIRQTVDAERPTAVAVLRDVDALELDGIVSIAAGGSVTYDPTTGAVTGISSFSLALKSDGTLYSWGSNGNGELADGTTTKRLGAVASGGSVRFSNRAPTVGLSLNTATSALPGTFTVTATPSDLDGNLSISRVDFFQNGALIGSRTASPWSITTSGLPLGTYNFSASAIDTYGATGTSITGVGTVTLPTITLNANPTVLYEGLGQGNFIISRNNSPPPPVPLTVHFSISGTANAADYQGISASPVVIPAGSAGVSVPMSAILDGFPDGGETVICNIVANAAYLGTPSATITINEPLGSVGVAAVETNAVEPSGSIVAAPARFIVFRTGSGSASVPIAFSGTALRNTDYTAPVGTSIPFAFGETIMEVIITPSSDSTTEGIETITVTISPPAGYLVSGRTSATATLSDLGAKPLISVAASQANAAEPATPGSFLISRTGPTHADLPVAFTVAGSASADSPGDYVRLPAAAIISANASSVEVRVPVIDDYVVEQPETVVVTLTTSALYNRGTSSATVTITDNDQPAAGDTQAPLITLTGPSGASINP